MAGGLAAHVQAAKDEIKTKFGITNIGGFATSGHITNSDHYTGHALDVMTSDIGKGTMVAEWALANAQRLGVKYVIWNRRINNLNGKGWTPYSGSSPHTDHVHISFHSKAGSGPTVEPSGSSGTDDAALSGCAQILGIG